MLEQDSLFLKTALKLAARGGGRTAPNPLVGAVVVREGRLLGQGFHAFYGGPHAEAAALEAAGGSAAGATLYCNLEPCSQTYPGKHQPPCTELIIAAGLKRVVVGQIDPHPRARGRGLKRLQEAGIMVELAAEPAAWKLNEVFNTNWTLGRPFVHLKIAQSLDGCIAAAGGRSRWISNEAARRRVQRMRAVHDAVLVGIGTVLADDPILTVHFGRGRNPLAVVLDTRLRLPSSSRLVRERARELLVCAGPRPDPARRRELEEAGARVLSLPLDGTGRVSLEMALEALRSREVRSVLVEGGGAVNSSFARQRLFDRLTVFAAPLLLGGGRRAFADLQTPELTSALRLEDLCVRPLDGQAVIEAYRSGWLEQTYKQVREVEHVHRAG